MRRVVGVMVLAGLMPAVFATCATAAQNVLPHATPDLRAMLGERIFGETRDRDASLAAAYGNRSQESLLRDLAFDVRLAPAHVADVAFAPAQTPVPTFSDERVRIVPSLATGTLGRLIDERLLAAGAAPRFTAAPVSAQTAARANADVDARAAEAAVSFPTAFYQPVEPVPDVSPQPGAVSFGPLANADGGLTLAQALRSSAALPSAALRMGPVQIQSQLDANTSDTPQIALHDSAYGAGANVNVRAGDRTVNLGLNSSYERVTRADASAPTAATFQTASNWQLPSDDVPVVIPNYADMSKVSVGAAVAVPVMNHLTLNLNYDTQRLLGGYGLPGLVNLDATNNTYGGKLVFQLPNSSSTLSLSARQSRFQDNLLPANTFNQTREDLNFTVKF